MTVELSPDIAAVLPSGDAAWLTRPQGHADYLCVICRETSTSTRTTPAAVVLLNDGGNLINAALAHRACSPSRVILLSEGTLRVPGDGLEMLASSGVLAVAGAPWPMIVLTVPTRVTGLDGETDLTDQMFTRQGMHPVAALSRLPPPLSGRWEAVFPHDAARITVTGDDGAATSFYSGGLTHGPAWDGLLAERGAVLLLAGTTLDPARLWNPYSAKKELKRAARQGALRGGLLPAAR